MVEKLFPKLSMALDLKLRTICFITCQVEGSQNILKLSCRPLVFNSYKDFLKIKRRSGTIWNYYPCHIFWMISEEKYFINLPDFIVCFTSWDIAQCVYCNSLLTRLWPHKFCNQPYLSNQVSVLHNQKVKTKNWIS